MTNVIQLNAPSYRQSDATRLSHLIDSFACHRRMRDDVFWLKENAELLNILECSGVSLPGQALEIHEEFYATIEKRISFFPQYYRFLLSVCLDLEALGMPGNKGQRLVDWAVSQGVADAELSDLQRGEARRLMARRGVDPLPRDTGLHDRMRGFCARAATFALPNKKAAYELTHTVFYLSEYGRRDPQMAEGTARSLDYAGTLAFLEQNADLLAEICVAMRFAGLTPPREWEGWLSREMRYFDVAYGDQAPAQDNYHEYLVGNWALAARGRAAFTARTKAGRMGFINAGRGAGPLRDMSESLYRMADTRSADWAQMRPRVITGMSDEAHQLLVAAEAGSADFEGFFANFARCGLSH
ncbi:MAG: DUF6902 family protein [Paracoccaceae bacterium]